MTAAARTHWAAMGESTFVFGIWLLYGIHRVFGRWPFRLCLYPVVFTHWALRPVVRSASAQYLARIEAARANQAQARSALLPQIGAGLSGQRGITQPSSPLATTWSGGLQAAWEVDLVGANRTASQAAVAPDSNSPSWLDAPMKIELTARPVPVKFGVLAPLAVLRTRHRSILLPLENWKPPFWKETNWMPSKTKPPAMLQPKLQSEPKERYRVATPASL